MKEIYDQYCEYVDLYHRAANTKDSYKRDIKKYLDTIKNFNRVLWKTRNFINSIDNFRTKNRYLASIKDFSSFLETIGTFSLSAIRSVKSYPVTDNKPNMVSKESIKRIIHTLAEGDVLDRRNALMMAFLFRNSLKPSELIQLTYDYVDFANSRIKIPSRNEWLYLNSTEIDLIEYIHSDDSNYLFYSVKTKGPLNRKSIWRLIKSIGDQFDLKLNPRSLTYSFIKDIEVDEEVVRRWLNHKDIHTTKRYLDRILL